MNRLKYCLSLLLLLSVTSVAQTPNSWTGIAAFAGGARGGCISFSIDSFGYVGLGVAADTIHGGYIYFNDLWQYNPYINTWARKANFPGTGRMGTICFVIGSKVYVGLGQYYKDLWEYDPATDVWTQKADFGGGQRDLCIGFSIGSKGYVGLGYSPISSDNAQDIWEYDPVIDTWTQKNNFAGGARAHAIAFSIGNNGYVGFGDSTSNTSYYYSDLWQYDPVADSWIRKADYTGRPREYAFTFVIGNKAYIGTGADSTGALFKDFWEYNSLTDQWIEKDSFGGWMRDGAAGFSIGNYGYAGIGDTNYNTLSKDFWKYTPDSIATGIRDIQANDISIYPDPAIDRVSINNLPSDATTTITDMTGRACNAPIAGNQIDVFALPAGVYCLRIQDSGGSVVRKFVKE